MRRKRKLLPLLAIGLGITACETPLSSSPNPSVSDSTSASTTTSSDLSTPSSSAPDSTTSSSTSTSSSSSIVDETAIPEKMRGTWEGNDGRSFYRLVADEESIVLNGIQGEITKPIQAVDGGYQGEIRFEETTYVLDYYESTFDGSVSLRLQLGTKTIYLYDDGSFHGLTLPEAFHGRWEGVNLADSTDDRLYVIEVDDGHLFFEDTEGTIWTKEDIEETARIEVEGVFYELAILDTYLSVQSEDETFRALMERDLIPPDPPEGTYIPEDSRWFGTWTDETHTLVVTEDGKWTLDGKVAEQVLEDNSYIILRYDIENTKRSYHLLLKEQGTELVVEITSLSEGTWTLHKEGAVEEEIFLPKEWIGAWVGNDNEGAEHRFVVYEDGTFTLDNIAGVVSEFDEQYGEYTLTIEEVDYTARMQADGNIHIYSFSLGFDVTFAPEEDEKDPIEIPEELIGTWKGTGGEEELTLIFYEDDTLTLNGQKAEMTFLEARDDGTYNGTFEADGIAYSFSYVRTTAQEREHLLLSSDSLAEIRLDKELLSIAVTIPEEMAGTWNSSDGHTLVLKDGSITLDEKEGIFLEEILATEEGGYETVVAFDGIEHSLAYGDFGFGPRIQLDNLATSYTDFSSFKKEEEVVEEPVVLPSFLFGTWEGSNVMDGSTYTLSIQEDSTVILNDVQAESVQAYDEGLGRFSFTLGGSNYQVRYDTVPEETLALSNIDLGIRASLKKKEEGEDDPSLLPEGLVGTWVGTDSITSITCTLVVEADGTTTVNGLSPTQPAQWTETNGTYKLEGTFGDETWTFTYYSFSNSMNALTASYSFMASLYKQA